MNTDPILRSVTELIVRCLDPEAIILFGSVARGRARPDSDIDLLVIAPFREHRQHRAEELRGLLGRMPLAADLQLLTPEEFAAEARQPNSFICSVRRCGVRLYQRASGFRGGERVDTP